MKKTTFTLLLALLAFYGNTTTWVVTNSGFSFSPATLTINEGDSVLFDLDAIHTAAEVSMATWNANGNSPVIGFDLPFGGGLVLPADLEEGTHFYVCEPHASMGMKGMIIVEGTTSIAPDPIVSMLSLYPNPTTGVVQVRILTAGSDLTNYSMEIFNILGNRIYATKDLEGVSLSGIDLSAYNEGIYLVRVKHGSQTYTQKLVLD